MREKFHKVLNSKRRTRNSCSIDFLGPFTSMTVYQFKRTVDSMEAFVKGGCTTQAETGIFRRLAYHLVMNNFTEPQSLEGLDIKIFDPFLDGPQDTTAIVRSIATGNRVAEEIRNREATARAT